MATYSFESDVHYYQGSWNTHKFGSTSNGGSIAGELNEDYRAIVGITIKPDENEIVTAFTLKIGYLSTYNVATCLGGYLYDSLTTAKSSVSGAPAGYMAHAKESEAAVPTASGRMAALTFEGLYIKEETTVYVWFYVDPSGHSQIWTGASGNVKKPTVEVTAIVGGIVYIDDGTSIEAYRFFIDNGEGWEQHRPHIDNSEGWDLC